ncbi:MAG: sulfatase-like hydrolase/transferase [Planctomycetota bacterium]
MMWFWVAIIGIAVNSTTAERPNVVIIVVDDQSPLELKQYNPRSTLQTPNLDRLAAEGMVIDDARHMGAWSGAVCTPSRHMIMSGRTVWHIPNRKSRKGRKPLANPNAVNTALVPPDLETNTLAAVFNRAGFDTMRTCKTGNSYEGANRQFTVRHDAMKRGGDAQSGSQWHGDRVLDFLQSREKQNDPTNPFLVYFGFSHPHDTRDGTPEYLAQYGATNHSDPDVPPAQNDQQPALPINYLPAHPFPHGHPGLRDEVSVSGVWERRDIGTIRNELGRQYACSANIDAQIGRVLDHLETTGQLDNTYVIYTSDHGMAIGRHGLQGKQNLYEHTWRVPMIVRGPGITAATRATGNVYLLDLLATICDLTGVDPPATNEGISFVPVLRGEQDSIRNISFGVYCGGTKPGMRAVKQGPWKLVEYDVLDGTVRKTQLFNLDENPHEFLIEHHAADVVAATGVKPTSNQVNLADDPRYADQLKLMRVLLAEQMRRHDDPYRLWNQTADR